MSTHRPICQFFARAFGGIIGPQQFLLPPRMQIHIFNKKIIKIIDLKVYLRLCIKVIFQNFIFFTLGFGFRRGAIGLFRVCRSFGTYSPYSSAYSTTHKPCYLVPCQNSAGFCGFLLLQRWYQSYTVVQHFSTLDAYLQILPINSSFEQGFCSSLHHEFFLLRSHLMGLFGQHMKLPM